MRFREVRDMEPEELRRLVRQPEGSNLEFKSNVPGSDTLAAHIAAFANTDGGTIVIGAREGGTIAGVDNMDRVQVQVGHALTAISPSVQVQTETVNVDEKAVIVLTVPKGQRPPYLASGRALQRDGAELAPLDAHRLLSHINGRAMSPDEYRDEITRLAQAFEVLNRELVAARSWKTKLPDMLIGGLVGAAISLGIALATGI
jgi:predicted HTH transcriptional regulator